MQYHCVLSQEVKLALGHVQKQGWFEEASTDPEEMKIVIESIARERTGNREQKELRMFYRLNFRPGTAEQELKYPPHRIEM